MHGILNNATESLNTQWIVTLFPFERRFTVVSEINNYYRVIRNRNIQQRD